MSDDRRDEESLHSLEMRKQRLRYHELGHRTVWQHELLTYGVFAAVLLWFASFGGYVHRIRRRLRQDNEALDVARRRGALRSQGRRAKPRRVAAVSWACRCLAARVNVGHFTFFHPVAA